MTWNEETRSWLELKQERDALVLEAEERGRRSERADILKRASSYADGFHFSGDLYMEKAIRNFFKRLSEDWK